jgi:soluble P-type ATPase
MPGGKRIEVQPMNKPGITIDIPGFGKLQINAILSDYTGTLAFSGKLVTGVIDRLLRLAELVDIHVVTADSFGTAEKELRGLPLVCKRLEGEGEDVQKRHYAEELNPRYVASFGNGNNDRLHMKVVKEAGGLAIAVENGEGCALEAILNANVFVYGAVNALDLLLEPTRLRATLRF